MGDYRITNTKHYQVVREGKYDYDRVPVDASNKLREDLMLAIEPFDYRSMTDFSLQYMSGFLAEQYDISPEEAEKIMTGRVEDHTLAQLRREVSGYGSFQLKHTRLEEDDSSIPFLLKLKLPAGREISSYRQLFFAFLFIHLPVSVLWQNGRPQTVPVPVHGVQGFDLYRWPDGDGSGRRSGSPPAG